MQSRMYGKLERIAIKFCIHKIIILIILNYYNYHHIYHYMITNTTVYLSTNLVSFWHVTSMTELHQAKWTQTQQQHLQCYCYRKYTHTYCHIWQLLSHFVSLWKTWQFSFAFVSPGMNSKPTPTANKMFHIM